MAPKQKVNDEVFEMMTAVADKTDVNLEESAKLDKSTKSIHIALMAAGMTPAYGNIADITDATLYALEGELGNAAWSAAAAIPIIGQMVSAKRALKVAKEAGEETVKLYRGVPDWFPGKMVKEGKFVSPQNVEYFGKKTPQPSKKGIFVSVGKRTDVEGYARPPSQPGQPGYGKFNMQTVKRNKPAILEFEVPKSWFDKKMKIFEDLQKEHLETTGRSIFGYWIDEGIPKGFLKKVHKQ
jgi:hypothetical protein